MQCSYHHHSMWGKHPRKYHLLFFWRFGYLNQIYKGLCEGAFKGTNNQLSKYNVDFRGNRTLRGDIKNIGEARADFVIINFVFRS